MNEYRVRWLAVAALLLSALVGGTGWLPFRILQDRGVHPLWTVVLVYLLPLVCITAARPLAMREFAQAPGLWILSLAFGAMNASFFWGVSTGDVVRVVLLFNLSPVWTVLLARVVLREPFTRERVLQVSVATAGAAIVLWPSSAGAFASGLPLPSSRADWLGVLGGMSFAANNVMLRHQQERSDLAKSMSMFVGGTVVAGSLAAALASQGAMAWLPEASPAWLGLIAALALWIAAGNAGLQYGASRLPANVTAVVMLTEIVFSTVSAWMGDATRLTVPVILGGVLIVTAAWLAIEPAATD